LTNSRVSGTQLLSAVLHGMTLVTQIGTHFEREISEFVAVPVVGSSVELSLALVV
jgi:hypothetical protein